MREVRAVLAVLLLVVPAGCASYQPDPLDPEMERLALASVSLENLQLERLRPGTGAESDAVTFDPTDGLDEPELIAVALTLNPDLRLLRIQSGESRALLIQAGRWPNPELGVGWRAGLGNSPGSTVEADALWELLMPWERDARQAAATSQVAGADAALVAAEWQLVAAVRQAHLQVLSGERSLALLDEEVLLREQALAHASRRKEAGDGTELDVSAAELEAAEVRRDRRHTVAELDATRRNLNRILGLPPEYNLRLTATGQPLQVAVYEDLADDELERRLLAGRAELRAQELAYETAEQQLHLAIYRQYPHLKIGPAFGKELDGGTSFGFGLAIDLPIFDRNQGEIAEKENQREQARAGYVALLHRLKAEAYAARAKLRVARGELEMHTKEILPWITRNRQLFESAFRARELSILDWVTAQQRVLRARQAYLETVLRYQESVVELETATGTSLASAVPAPVERQE